MGTSQSSGGPAGGTPMVPPWTPPPPDGGNPPEQPPETGQPPNPPAPTDGAAPPAPFNPTAPSGRFAGARRGIGEFARNGNSRDLRRGLGHYVRTGYGGSGTTARRFGGTAATAGTLGGVLANAATRGPVAVDSPLNPALLAGKSAREVIDAVVEAVRPVDGTQDAEAERASIHDALSELLTRFPEADLLNLNEEQRGFAIEQFTAIDVFRRFDLDLGKTIIEKAPDAAAALSRLKQARDYIKESVLSAFRHLRNLGKTLSPGRINHVVREALQGAFEVFEGYTE